MEHELSMAWRLCWVPDVLCLLLRTIPSHLCRPHPSSLAQPWTQACMNVSTVFTCICLHMFDLWSVIDVQMFEESSVGVLAFMSKRSSLVSNVMHSVRHALHINLHMFVGCLFSPLEHELSMAWRLCWVPDVLCLLLRAIIPSHLRRPHPSSLAQPRTQACMNVSTVFACICLYMFDWQSAMACKCSRNRVLACSLSCPRGLALSLM
jgi:hypothetical protein